MSALSDTPTVVHLEHSSPTSPPPLCQLLALSMDHMSVFRVRNVSDMSLLFLLRATSAVIASLRLSNEPLVRHAQVSSSVKCVSMKSSDILELG